MVSIIYGGGWRNVNKLMQNAKITSRPSHQVEKICGKGILFAKRTSNKLILKESEVQKIYIT